MILIYVFQIVALVFKSKAHPKSMGYLFLQFSILKMFHVCHSLSPCHGEIRDCRTGADCQMLPSMKHITDISSLPPTNEVSYCTALLLKLRLIL